MARPLLLQPCGVPSLQEACDPAFWMSGHMLEPSFEMPRHLFAPRAQLPCEVSCSPACHFAFMSLSGILSCGRLGPASDGTTVEISSSSVLENRGCGDSAVRVFGCPCCVRPRGGAWSGRDHGAERHQSSWLPSDIQSTPYLGRKRVCVAKLDSPPTRARTRTPARASGMRLGVMCVVDMRACVVSSATPS